MTGAELRAHRKAAGLSQKSLAEHAGVCRETVQYWESKAEVPAWGVAPQRFREVLGLGQHDVTCARTRRWGHTLQNSVQGELDAYVEARLAHMRECEAQRAARRRVICGARTRKGTDCRNKSEPGRGRCKFHGGMSTGPRTPEGRERIAEAQRRRWARSRHGSADVTLPS